MRTETTGPLSPEQLDQYHRALSNQWRRIVVSVLDRRRAVRLTELADEIVRRTDDDQSADRVALALRHCHLPLLADARVVEFDGETVRRRQPWFGTLSELNQRTAV
ncbi:DUF7344 domain-containing protein [Haloarchaeobius litoreus]|uniref:DUF7344 domain-containing protein n=1 Tax=Haloarchaeobius litoreus TaxID=755306 RepID=A0ABD6DHF1_9EURY|nr:hypothetical protein [Haloarchaeobius litoreus]